MKTIFLSRKAARVAGMLVLLLVCISTASVVFSQAQLVKDLNTSEYRHFNEYSQLTNAEGLFYFVSNGKELWKSDGTTPGTKRVRMVRGIQNLTLIGNILYFGTTNESAAELWKSDGTYAGTMRVKQIRKGINSSTPKSFTNVNGTVFFVADNGTGYELWKTNGTLSGTVMVKDIWRGPEGSEPAYLTVLNNMLYFSADDGVHGRELWKSDGTAAGTVMVKDIQTPEGESSEPMELVTMNGFLFFSANNSLSGRELWRSDGTASRTILLNDINPGAASAEIGSIRRMGNAIYFNATKATIGTSLWRSSGTTAGTVMLKDLTSDESEFQVFDMTVLNNRIYWLQAGGPYSYAGHEVWVSNGTAAGTRLVTTFERWHTPARFTFMNNKVFYLSGYWEVEETYGPFQQLCSINPDGSGWSEAWKMQIPFNVAGGEEDQYYYSLELIAFNNALFFPGVRNEVEGYKLLKSNGTGTPPAILVDTYRPTQSSTFHPLETGNLPNTMVKNNSDIYFTTTGNDWYDQHLWRTDGTRAGTIRIKSHFGIANVISMNKAIYFTVRIDNNGWQLWKTGGTITGTLMVKENYVDYDPVLGRANVVEGMVKAENRLFFYTYPGELWRSDGTAAGTVFLKKFPHIEHIASFGSGVYAIVRTASAGQELWKSNGTAAGTVRVKTIRSGEGPTSPNHLAAATMGNIFYFVGHDGIHGQEIWRTDGTAAGTFMVKDIGSDNGGCCADVIWRAAAFNNFLYINSEDINGQLSLFKSDGTSAGTQKIHESDRIFEFIPYNDQLLFLGSGDSGFGVWSTDGTTVGTTHVKGLPDPHELSISTVQLNGIVYIAYQNSMGIWRTDGTECGTFGIDVGLQNVNNLAPTGSNLVFSASHPYYGNELFSFNVSNVSAPSCPESFAARQVTSDEGEIKNVTYSPNPFDRDFTFVVSSNLESTAEVAVYDMAGHPLIRDILETNKPHQLGNNWKEGLYIMRIFVDGNVTVKKVIKGRP